MAEKIFVAGFDSFINKLEEHKPSKKDIYVMFSGSKNTATGKSWCPDCVVAEPVVNSALNSSSKAEDSVYIYVSVGGRDFWKDPKCIFRTDSRTKLKTVPTLIKYGTSQRLEEKQCADADLVNMMFE